MLQNIVNFVKTNKKEIIEKGVTVVAALAGIALVGVVANKFAQDGEVSTEVVNDIVDGVAGQ